MEDGADVGLAVGSGGPQGVAVEGLVTDDRLDSGDLGDLLDGLGVVGVLSEDGHGPGGLDLVRGLLDLVGGGVLLGVEVGQGGPLELHAELLAEVAEGVVAGEQDPLVLGYRVEGAGGPFVELLELGDVGVHVAAEDAGLVGGGLLQGGTDVGDLDDRVLR